MKRNILFILAVFCSMLSGLYGQDTMAYQLGAGRANLSIGKSYVYSLTPTIATTLADTLTAFSSMQTVQYFDGLGRPEEIVQIGVTPGRNDLVAYQEYDRLGRATNSWLPVMATGNNGGFVSLNNVIANVPAVYGADNKPYSKPVYDNSPLNRVVQQYGPGMEWHNNSRATSGAYLTNLAKFGSTTLTITDSLVCGLYIADDNNIQVKIHRTGNYLAGSLFVIRGKDEEGNTTYEFTDKQGRLVLVRQLCDNKLHDTYYVYDSYGCLRCVLPPAASDLLINTAPTAPWTDSNPTMQQYAYLYQYGNRNLCIAKKLPGAGWTYYVYDKADRLIYSQDAEQRKKNQWAFSLQDAFGRSVLTGIYDGLYMEYSQNPLLGLEISAVWNPGNAHYFGYRLVGLSPSSNIKVKTANFYDQYDFLSFTGFPDLIYTNPVSNDYGSRYAPSYKGLLTGTYVAEVGEGATVLRSALYYDYRQQLIQSKSTNQVDGTDCEYIGYNFSGQPLKRMHTHTAGSNRPAQTEYYSYTYDHAGRLKETKHRLNSGGEYSLSFKTYDDLGRLKKTVRNGRADLTENFEYNVRSWMKGITGTQFAENMAYAYNGNINRIDWIQNGQTRKYVFGYDALSRLKSANYTGVGYENYNTAYTYDKQGNMVTLQRYGKTAPGTGSTSYGLIDNLSMGYAGNQLTHVAETVIPNILLPESNDFKKHAPATINPTYYYNSNGALKQDLNKGISDISYNLLSLPEQMDILSPMAEARNIYTYSADGKKLRVVQKWNSNYSTNPRIGDPINANSLNNTKTTEYAGNMIYEGTGTSATSLKRILIDGGYIEGDVYHFYFRDHLGNNRAVVNATGAVVQRSHYYPFGMTFAETSSTDQNKQLYQYNGKELDRTHGLNLYDYSARHMEPALGRFTTVDPMAEKYYSVSPYSYCNNNPIIYIDIDGREWFYYSVNGKDDPTWVWHDGHEYNTGVKDSDGNEVVLTGVEAAVVFEGSRTEQLGTKKGKGGYINGEGTITAKVTVYGPKGEDDIHTFTGYTMSSNVNKYGAIDEGMYDGNYDAVGKSGSLKSNWVLNHRGQIRMMDGKINPYAKKQITSDGEGYKTGIFIHSTNSNGYAGVTSTGPISAGCLLISPADWKSFNRVMSGVKDFRVQVIRDVLYKVPLQGVTGIVPNTYTIKSEKKYD